MNRTQTTLGITNETILTAGPYINHKEINYAADAAKNGWNHHHSDYIHKLQETFTNYIGVKHGMVTSSCTGALHLGLASLGIQEGDEVIVPDVTWIASVVPIIYLGAKPVFADIEPETWVMDPKSVEKKITSKTKAIIPVHLYGQPVDMDPIMDMAEKHNLKILEDAAPSIGSHYKGRKTGTFGHMAAYSFHGAKAVAIGEGGMLISDDKDLIDRAFYLNNHGRASMSTLFNTEIGYKYKMSNVQAAVGLAQMEKIEEILAKKKQICFWYKDRLKDIPEIMMNYERPDTVNNFYMSIMTLGDGLSIERDDFLKELKARNIDTRPLFYPVSSFPMFDSCEDENPNAYKVSYRSLHLPSGHDRTEEEIDYICAHIRDIVGKDIKNVSVQQPSGWLAARDKIQNTFKELKSSGSFENLSVKNDEDKNSITLSSAAGEITLNNFNYPERFCEVQLSATSDDLISTAKQVLDWAKSELELKEIYTKVQSKESDLLAAYEKLGLKEIQRFPLMPSTDGGEDNYTDAIYQPYVEIENYLVTLKHS